MRPLRVLGLLADADAWRTLSYTRSLPRAVGRHPAFRLTLANVINLSLPERIALRARLRFGKHDAVFIFHSAFSNMNCIRPEFEEDMRTARRPCVFFVGNEYKLMHEKIDFARRLGVALLVTQISRRPVRDLYRDALGCDVLFLPNAIFDPELVPAGPPTVKRRISIGYRAFDGVFYLGHDDRVQIARLIEGPAQARGFSTDISLDPADRFDEKGWFAFLADCRCQLGVESGSDAFELDDRTRVAVNDYCEAHPSATFEDVRREFFADMTGRVSGRTISSRHLEAAAARCVQMLLPGEYGGVFKPDEHYIEIARDGSNVAAALDRLSDDDACTRMAEAAYEAAADNFGEARLMGRLETAVRAIAA
jgi:hypothetical protein